jgi:hypothetical protein
MLPTLFEGIMQQGQASAGAGRNSEGVGLSPAASAAATAATGSSRLPSDAAVSILLGGTRQPSALYMSEARYEMTYYVKLQRYAMPAVATLVLSGSRCQCRRHPAELCTRVILQIAAVSPA